VPEVLGEYIDRLCTIEMRPASGALPRGVIHRLYSEARRAHDQPLSSGMAGALLSRVGPNDAFFVVTGAGGPPIWPYGEVDGLLGAAALARAMSLSVGARPIFLAEERTKGPLLAACRSAGLNVATYGDDWSEGRAGVFVATPIDATASKESASGLLDTFSPRAVIAIEKLAPNRLGVIHGATGLNFDDVEGKPQYVFDEANKRSVLTAGIGDGGNEVGFGKLTDAVADIMPHGRICQCPCGGGSAADVATDFLMVAAISDWGGYGVAAMIAYMTETPEAFISPTDVRRMLEACVEAGALDGVTARPVLRDDGVPVVVHEAFVTMLGGCIDSARWRPDLPGH
jgi:hypothetical protein